VKTFANSQGDPLTLSEWARVIGEANALGNLYLDISGGEPLLYPFVTHLVAEAKRYGWYVSLNTNGRAFDGDCCDRLLHAGLDRIIVSCISLDETINDRARRCKDSLAGVLRTIELLSNAPVACLMHLILSKHNYRELDSIIEFCFSKRVSALSLVYPENAFFDESLRMNADQVREFRAEILPRVIEEYSRAYRAVHKQEAPAESLRNLSRLCSKPPENLSRGIYSTDYPPDNLCQKPEQFALIYANGDVLPCNGIEYMGEPIVGNVKNEGLLEILSGPAFIEFKRSKCEFCRFCPIPDHTGIAIMSTDIPPYTRELSRSVLPTR